VIISLPLPPPTNNLYTNGRNGRRVLTGKARAWKEEASRLAMVARCQQHGVLLCCPVVVSVELYLKHDRDVDNIKALLDALSGVIYDDDRRVTELHIRKAKVAKGDEPRAIVRVWAGAEQ
jgi:Holliday junction resolvase RusA-like endonuclease